MGKFAGTMAVLTLAFLQACSGGSEQTLPSAPAATLQQTEDVPIYVIGPLDTLEVFVWGNPELSSGATVRPDGRVTLPIVEDMPAAGKTPAALAREIETELGKFVVDPIVTVSVTGFVGPFAQQVRIVGEASEPQAIPYRANMTILDVMIAVSGLTEFADGNRTQLVRVEDNEQVAYNVRLDDLLRDGDISANVSVFPGDVIIIPESWF
jgi:polysaccharide export outer membrane protein